MKILTKSVIGVAAAVLAGAAALTPVLVTAWGDDANGRQVYTLEQINEGALGNDITFNSITNGAIGDERNFVAAKPQGEVADKNIAWKANEIEVKDGETYTIRLYVHNNSPLGTAAIATGVRANFSLPTTVGKELTAIGYITAPNAKPTKYWDEVTFKSDDNFYLEYVDGSATYTNNKGTFKLPNEVVVSTGAQLGYEQMDGNIPGCYQYDGEVHIQVVAHKSVTASVEKKVRMKGTKEWSEAVTAKVGDEVEYQIEYVNLLQDSVKNVMIRDILPDNVEYVPGSTKLYNSIYQNGVEVPEETLTTTGINIGDHAAKANSYVRFTGKVIDKNLACGQNQLVNWANSTSGGEVTAKDDASVMVSKTCKETEPENPPKQDTPEPETPQKQEEPTPEPEPETPDQIVSTGAGTIATGAIGAGSMVTLLGYYLASRKKLG